MVIVVPNNHEVTVELSALDHAGSEGRAFGGELQSILMVLVLLN